MFAIILFLLLAVSLFYNLANFAGSFLEAAGAPVASGGPRLLESVREDNHAQDKIAVLEINGIIMGDAVGSSGFSLVDVLRAQLKRARQDARVKAVVLKVDSPGGEVLASDDIYKAIQDFQETTQKPVIASMGSLAASGGYYVSAPCRWIVANELTITGSIGVIMNSLNYRGLMDKVGLQPQVFKSGKYKDMLSGSRPPESITEEERGMVQKLVLETYGHFKDIVAEGRKSANSLNKNAGRKLVENWVDYADGRVFSGQEAYKLGFVDELGSFEDAVDRAKSIAGIAKANLVSYPLHYDLGDFFRMFGKTEAPALKIDLGTDLQKLRAGRLYFLSPTLLQ